MSNCSMPTAGCPRDGRRLVGTSNPPSDRHMPAQRHVFTSESVTEGHPDKIADQISDAVLDAIIAKDPTARVACETLVTTGMAVVAGGGTTHPPLPPPRQRPGPHHPPPATR